MNKKQVIGLLILLTGISAFISCGGPSVATYQNKPNYSFLYNPASTRIHPVVQVYHESDSLSDLTIKLFPDELLFNKANSKGVMLSSITVSYVLQEIAPDGKLMAGPADSAVNKHEIEKDDVTKRYYINTMIKAKRGHNYYLTVKVRDNHRNAMATKFYYVEKDNNFGRQDFKVVYARNGQDAFDPLVINGEDVRVYFSDKTVGKMFVKYYRDYQEDPPPVNMVIVEPSIYKKYDSIFQVDFRDYIDFSWDNEGLYLLQTDTSVENGLALINFHGDFPKIEGQLQLARPLLYLQSDVKYREMLNARNKKMAVDNFWLDIAGDNTERARQLVRIYYNRVFFANYFFTSYKEGWLTDRGLVYIIYGQPDLIHKDPEKEEWIYLGNNMTRLLAFEFTRKKNAFSHNHFVLNRSDGKNTYWREAMISWQGGNVFSVDNL